MVELRFARIIDYYILRGNAEKNKNAWQAGKNCLKTSSKSCAILYNMLTEETGGAAMPGCPHGRNKTKGDCRVCIQSDDCILLDILSKLNSLDKTIKKAMLVKSNK